jgi:VanZ family protein
MRLSRKHRVFLVICYAVIITTLSLLPATNAPAFGGLWDKFQHFGAYALFMMLAFPLAHSHRWRLMTAIGIIIYSAIMEYAQRLSPGRHTSWEDIFANSLGVAAGYLLVWGLLSGSKYFSKNQRNK